MDFGKFLKKLWYFIWHEDSLLSWIVNIILAFVIVKFLLLPGLGLVLGTQFPLVAVVSGSIEHNSNFDDWWDDKGNFYERQGLNKTDFENYKFKNGFNKGDVIILKRANNLKVGDVIVFQGDPKDPIIHRIIKISNNGYTTRGDNNLGTRIDEKDIVGDRVFGKAIFRIPYLGWVKISVLEVFYSITGGHPSDIQQGLPQNAINFDFR